MRKTLTFIITIVMALSLAACYAPSKKPAIAAHNRVQKTFSEAVDIVNENIDKVTKEEIQKMNETREIFNQQAHLLNSTEQIDQKTLNEMIKWYKTVEQWTTELVAEVKNEAENMEQPVLETTNVSVEVINKTGFDIYVLAASPVNNGNWEKDVLIEHLGVDKADTTEIAFNNDNPLWNVIVEDNKGNEISFIGVDFSKASAEGAQLVLSVSETGEYVATFAE